MNVKVLEIVISIILGFFTGVLLSDSYDISVSGLHILLGCIFWMLVFIFLRLPSKRG
ncbi:hypothetical protein NQ117_22235 [Paenibacillus sp. SC116]|uniref:hypothetical protein n=1 Tax=Paenibacillus sp. SC116 TaxID=2968986 RepID=UPI00215A6832|nr:hypothetical protein [Paenibacillus sp. SC116]MCR8846409.1 hypothetical protein [Paenibacillus sp. SC116]